MAPSPRLAIGLPVRNGERYLHAAAMSLLRQSFADLTLLICDNASTDATPAIARELARADARVGYARHERNIGAAGNFSFAFRATRGGLFKWAADDDLYDPGFLARCIHELDRRPGAVLAHTAARWIGADGRDLGPLPRRDGLGSPRASERFIAALQPGYPSEIWGVMRREAVEATGLIRGFVNADRYFLAELLLQGGTVTAPEPLLLVRRHEGSFTHSFGQLGHRQRLRWFDPAGRWGGVPAMAGLAAHLLRRVACRRVPWDEGLACGAYLARRGAGFFGRRAAAGFRALLEPGRRAAGAAGEPDSAAGGSLPAARRPT